MSAPATRGVARGFVDSFDVEAGFGFVFSDDGTRHFFHCAEIADGSRNISPGTAVAFRLVAGHHGRFEGVALTELPARR